MKPGFLDSEHGKDLILMGAHYIETKPHIVPDILNVHASLELASEAALRNLTLLSVRALKGDSARIFRFDRDFAKELKNVKLNISSKHLTSLDSSILIEVPPGLFSFETHELKAIQVGTNKILGVFPITLYIHDKMEDEIVITIVSSPSSKDKLLSEWIDGFEAEEQKKILSFAVNAMLYLKSGDPDLREYAPKNSPLSYSFRKTYNVATKYAITGVAFGYKKEPLREADEWTVSGHFRWQPYGPKNSKLKLVWIKEHNKTWSKENIASNPQTK